MESTLGDDHTASIYRQPSLDEMCFKEENEGIDLGGYGIRMREMREEKKNDSFSEVGVIVDPTHFVA